MAYHIPPDDDAHPVRHADHLMRRLRLPEFAHLVEGEARIEWLMRSHEEIKGGRRILGSCHMPAVQGQLKDVFLWMLEEMFGDLPDFLIILDAQYWADASERDREILVFHELLHAIQKVDAYGSPRFQEDGTPCWGLRGHSVEEFNETVARYGAHSPDLVEFFGALQSYTPP